MRVPTSVARFLQHGIDVGVLAAAYVAAFLVRFEGAVPGQVRTTLLVSLPIVIVIQATLLRVYDVHRVAWRYIALRDTRRILMSVAVATLILLSIRTVIGHSAFSPVVSRWATVGYASSPIGVLLIDAVLAFCGLVGVRALRRLESERAEAQKRVRNGSSVPTLLVGAGRAGALVAREIVSRPDVGLNAVAFVDDDVAKIGTHINGVPVVGPTRDIPRIAEKLGAKQALISMASAPGADVRRVMKICEDAQLPVKIIPGLFEMINGSVSLNRIRDVAIEDLLRREPVELDIDGISKFLRGRAVLITGAGGSIGSELCRQVARFEPKVLVLVERTENNLFFIERELRETFPNLALVPCIADVCDAARMEQIFGTYHPHTVFHAAAYKHVPMMELNPAEAVKNNVFGTMTVADTADRFGVSEFVLISTDKAVNPVSVMGATKRAAEIYVQALSSRSETRFVAVRFGNVLGSAGSVVPIFREQIKKGGPVTITHPDMRRYFMTIPEATQLVLQAADVGTTGEVLILDMGAPVRLVDLAHDMIQLSGLRPNDDIEVVFSGIRPGERLFEELSTEEEAATRSHHPRVFVAKIRSPSWEEVVSAVAQARAHMERGASDSVRLGLRALVPEYHPAVHETMTLESTSDAERD
nr:UDP-N-acetyl-alpha-D-glucosamine C6 dehydratase [uncultured bacterium]